MKVMISLPMNGKKDSEVISRMKEIKEKFDKLHIDVIDSFINDEGPKDINHKNVYYLGRTIMNFLCEADAVYFDEGWEQARGCRIERKICEEYGIMILDKNFFSGSKPLYRENDGFTITPYITRPDDWPHITPCISPSSPLSTDPLPIERTIITCQNGKHFKDGDTITGNKLS